MAAVAQNLPAAPGAAAAPPSQQTRLQVKSGTDRVLDQVCFFAKIILQAGGLYFAIDVGVFVLTHDIAAIIAGTFALPYISIAISVSALVLGLLLPKNFFSKVDYQPSSSAPFLGMQNSGSDCALISVLQFLFNNSQQMQNYLYRHPDLRIVYNALQRRVTENNEHILPYEDTQRVRQYFMNRYPAVENLNSGGQFDAADLLRAILQGEDLQAHPTGVHSYEVSPTLQLCINRHYNPANRQAVPIPPRRTLEDYPAFHPIRHEHPQEKNGYIILPIRDGQSVGDLLGTYFEDANPSTEPLLMNDGEQLYSCPVHLTETRFSEVPDRLVLQFNRFKNERKENSIITRMLGGDQYYYERSKVHNPVDCSLEITLDGDYFTHNMAAIPPNPIYDVDTFIVHLGEYDGGHYITYLKKTDHLGNIQWYKCNDHVLTPVSIEEALWAVKYSYIVNLTKR